ncbi:MAG: TonB family protein [Myxococcales bacterium]|nr:TonB family protein [Myxococcales bacterium]
MSSPASAQSGQPPAGAIPNGAGGALAVPVGGGGVAGSGGATVGGRPGGGGVGVPAPSGDSARLALLARIRAHRRYPELARRRGIEGTVGLSFSVGKGGAVERLDVVKSAHPALDEAAREAVLAAAPLPLLAGRMEIDLDFRLRDAP